MVDFLINNLDKCIMIDQNIFLLNKNLGFNSNITQTCRFFFLGKTILNSILPNQGNILGYSLSDNFFKFVYNYCFKTKDESFFILKHNFKIFGNSYNIIFNKLNVNNNCSISPLENDNIASSLEPDILYDFNLLTNLNDETWDNFLNDIRYLNINENFNDYPFYNYLNKKFITILDLNCFFYYKYQKIDQLIGIKILSNSSNFIKNFKCKLNNEYLQIINLKNYFFIESDTNLLINLFNDLKKNEINFKLILNFIEILYTNPNCSYIHLYINMFNIENIKEFESLEVQEILSNLEFIICNRLRECKNIIENENKEFVNQLECINLLDQNQISDTEIIVDFLEELDNHPDNIQNSKIIKEFFLLKILKIAVNNFIPTED
jgi:hypothetical protein